jgi:Mn-containing catalase
MTDSDIEVLALPSLMKAFSLALESIYEQPRHSIDRVTPTPGLLDQFFNDSTGTHD